MHEDARASSLPNDPLPPPTPQTASALFGYAYTLLMDWPTAAKVVQVRAETTRRTTILFTALCTAPGPSQYGPRPKSHFRRPAPAIVPQDDPHPMTRTSHSRVLLMYY